MAITDMKNTVAGTKPNQATTTGLMNERVNIKPVKINPQLPQQETARPQTQSQVQAPVDSDTEATTEIEKEFVSRINSLTDEDKLNFTNILSPSVKNTLSKLLPELSEVMEDLGTNEPNVIIPLSTVKRYAVSKYGGTDEADAVNNFMADILSPEIQQASTMETQQTTNVPPSQPTETAGLMTSPQNMETV
jgi:hypothetical protein